MKYICSLFFLFPIIAFAAPRVALDSAAVDFGEVAANAALVREMRVGNVGDEPLVVARVKACCGATASLSEMTILPGTSSVLRVELNPGANPGAFRKSVTLYTNDPENRMLIIPLAGKVKEYELIPSSGGVAVVPVADADASPKESVPPTAGEPTVLDCTLPVILAAGFVDGFNPCAFSIIIALAGILAVGGHRRRARLLGGIAFCVSSYFTYMAMGFGLMRVIAALDALSLVRDILFALLSLALAVLAVLSVRDAFRYRRARIPAVITLQLPDRVKAMIKGFAASRWSGPTVVGSGLLCGFVITLLDSLCTGQVYLPVLALLAKRGDLTAWILLALYNLAFITPLVVLFVFAACGASSERMSRWSKRNVFPSKLALGALFALLAWLLWPDFHPRFYELHASRSASRPAADATRKFSLAELAERNLALDALAHETPVDRELLAEVVASVRDVSEDVQWRNHSLQVLPECIVRLGEDDPLRAEAMEVLNAALADRRTILGGTALLGLSRLAEKGIVEKSDFEYALLALATAPEATSENRATALMEAARIGLKSAAPAARHWARAGETPFLRLTAIAAVRDLEGVAAREFLLSLVSTASERERLLIGRTVEGFGR